MYSGAQGMTGSVSLQLEVVKNLIQTRHVICPIKKKICNDIAFLKKGKHFIKCEKLVELNSRCTQIRQFNI